MDHRLVNRPVVGYPARAQAADMHVLPPSALHGRVAPARRDVPARVDRWGRRRSNLWARLWLALGAAALLGTLLVTPPDWPRAELSGAANRCAAELGNRQGRFADVGGFRLLPSSERRGPRGFEADLRVRWNTAAGPNSGGITTVHCLVTGGKVTFTEAAPTGTAEPGAAGGGIGHRA